MLCVGRWAQYVVAIDEVFALFDTHGNQTITISQLGTLMRALGQIPTQAELKAIIDEVDADGNVDLSFAHNCLSVVFAKVH